jgi:molecular chaperone GrpE
MSDPQETQSPGATANPDSAADFLAAHAAAGSAATGSSSSSTGSSSAASGNTASGPQAHAQDSTTPADPLAAAQAEVAALQAKIADMQDQYVRGQAEVQNARRRADEEVSKARKFALESFADSLLPVMDSLEAGLAVQNATPEQIREGAEATLRQLVSALERNKVIAINPAAGAKFDPAQHQAISVVPAEQEANTVVTVLQKGYLIAERVLRPALVTVSAPK